MKIFTSRLLSQKHKNVGELLRAARIQKNLSIASVSEKLHLKSEYIQAMEDNDYSKLPAGLYGNKFIKKYANYLKLEIKETDNKDFDETNPTKLTKDPFSQKIIKKSNFLILPKILKNISIIVIFFICLLYLIYYFQKIVAPPKLSIYQPEKNFLSSSTSIIVNGQTEPESELKINNQTILNNENGYFSQTVNLKKGLNTIIISAKKNYSQERIITREILVQ